jgi:putative tryptophan/tyrosine transport system substrate-binding protein
MPVIGLLSSRAKDESVRLLAAFRRGLNETGYVEDQNVAIEYRWAQSKYDQLSSLADDLVRRQVTVIVVPEGSPGALAAKAATATIPIVFHVGGDPVAPGIVPSFRRPGGNITGVATLNVGVGQKRLELLHELLPTVTVIALLVNPANPVAETLTTDAHSAARRSGSNCKSYMLAPNAISIRSLQPCASFGQAGWSSVRMYSSTPRSGSSQHWQSVSPYRRSINIASSSRPAA